MGTEQTWEISDINGKNKRRVTLAQFRAELDARKPYTKAIIDAVRSGNVTAVVAAQKAMCDRFARR